MRNIVRVAITSIATVSVSFAASWFAQPLVVHEWGVNSFDWQGDSNYKMSGADLPDFYYTDQKPGKQAQAKSKVKNLPPDAGMRRKPLLYFYGNAPVGVEVKFNYGYANGWYPQVNVYRTDEEVKGAKPIDWVAWQQKEQNLNIIQRKISEVPDDPTYELVWYNLVVDNRKGSTKIMEPAPSDNHWVQIAREVDASYVSNGSEVERFVFYEAATTEIPGVTILPSEGGEYEVVNSKKFPIYDIFIVYRKGGKKFMQYHNKLAVGEKGVKIPNFDRLKADDVSEEEFQKWASNKLVKTLVTPLESDLPVPVMDKATGRKPFMFRDPADPQGAALSHVLYEKEAVGLEKIWREDFFQQEGLTIIYREAPAYLDDAMPLRIHTDMRHYILLNRCGLVCNNNINLKNIKAAYEVAPKVLTGTLTAGDQEVYDNNRLLVKTYLQYLSKK